jgi:hypothetical protein
VVVTKFILNAKEIEFDAVARVGTDYCLSSSKSIRRMLSVLSVCLPVVCHLSRRHTHTRYKHPPTHPTNHPTNQPTNTTTRTGTS